MARAPEEAEEEEDSQVGEELQTFQSVSARYDFLAMDRPDFLYSAKDFDAENGLTKQPGSRCLQKSSALQNQASKNGMQIPNRSNWTRTLRNSGERPVCEGMVQNYGDPGGEQWRI